MGQTPKKNSNAGPLPIRPFGSRENFALEFKEAARDLPKNFFETVCAFLNLEGGLIILGVAYPGSGKSHPASQGASCAVKTGIRARG